MKITIIIVIIRAYSSRKSWHLQFIHNSVLYFRTRPPNLCSHRRCERDFVLIPTHFYHATTLQLRAFARHSASLPARSLAIRHFDFRVFLVFNPGDLYYLGYKKIIIINNNIRAAASLPRDAMLARYMVWPCVRVYFCVCLSVCLSQVRVLLKQLNVVSGKQNHTIAQGL